MCVYRICNKSASLILEQISQSVLLMTDLARYKDKPDETAQKHVDIRYVLLGLQRSTGAHYSRLCLWEDWRKGNEFYSNGL